MSVCQLDSMNIQENGIDIRIDIEQFCLRMCKAAKSYYDKVNLEKDFSLYNTPVLDFIQVIQKKKDAYSRYFDNIRTLNAYQTTNYSVFYMLNIHLLTEEADYLQMLHQ